MHEVDTRPIDDLVAKHRAGRNAEYTLGDMPGGASTRRYYRLSFKDGSSAVAMFVPEGAKPEEIHKGAQHTRWPFLEVRDLLASRDVDVPAIFAEDTDRGWLLIEDLGEDTLANYLLRKPEEKRALYSRATLDLARAQKALAELGPGSVVGTRAFDEDLLRLEIDHFREWGIEGRGHALTAANRAELDAIGDRLARRIAGLPRGFVHRDYQSRNLMVRSNGSLVWIDFQDALMGPRVYDLVALLNDSYQEFDRAFVEARLTEYARAASLSPDEERALVREFDLVTVQRKLKDAGRFVFIDRVKHNPSFLKFVVPTIKKVRGALTHLVGADEDMRALDLLLSRVLPEDYGAPAV